MGDVDSLGELAVATIHFVKAAIAVSLSSSKSRLTSHLYPLLFLHTKAKHIPAK